MLKTGAAQSCFKTKFNSKLWETVKYVTALTDWQDTVLGCVYMLFHQNIHFLKLTACILASPLVTSILAYRATVAVKNKFLYL